MAIPRGRRCPSQSSRPSNPPLLRPLPRAPTPTTPQAPHAPMPTPPAPPPQTGTVLKLGTEKHHEGLLRGIDNMDAVGCFALTELGFGEPLSGGTDRQPDRQPDRRSCFMLYAMAARVPSTSECHTRALAAPPASGLPRPRRVAAGAGPAGGPAAARAAFAGRFRSARAPCPRAWALRVLNSGRPPFSPRRRMFERSPSCASPTKRQQRGGDADHRHLRRRKPGVHHPQPHDAEPKVLVRWIGLPEYPKYPTPLNPPQPQQSPG